MKLEEVLNRIDAVAAPRNLSDRELSLAAGGSPDLIRNWRRAVKEGKEARGARPRSIEAIARELGVSGDWLMSGVGELSGRVAVETLSPRQEPWQRIRCYGTENARDNEPLLSRSQTLFEVGFPKEMLNDIAPTRPENLALVRVTGGAMAPTLGHGDYALVDTSQRNLGLGGLFLLQAGGTLSVRRVEPLAEGRLRVRTDNPAHNPIDLEPGAGKILGSVVWTGRRV
jgi:hypothetical protein